VLSIYQATPPRTGKKIAQLFNLYLTATGKTDNGDIQKTSLLLHVIGEDALDIYDTFTWETQGKFI